MKGVKWTRAFVCIGLIVVADVLMTVLGLPRWLHMSVSVLMGLASGIYIEHDTA